MKPVTSQFYFIYYDSNGNTQERYFGNIVMSVNLLVCNINTGVEITWKIKHNGEWVDKKERFHLLKVEQSILDYSEGITFHISDVPKSFSTGFKGGGYMSDSELKFHEDDVEYWKEQMRIWPTDLTKDSLERAKKRLENYKNER